MEKANMTKLAKELNLSISTISKALQDSHEISAKTKQVVNELAKKYNYTPNHFASSLRKGKTKSIAVIIPEIANNFFALAIKEVIEYCKRDNIKRFYTLSPVPYLSEQFKVMPKENEIRLYLESKKGPVEKFHLNNGATISTINYFADNSQKRIDESWGIMVNYNYSMFHAPDTHHF